MSEPVVDLMHNLEVSVLNAKIARLAQENDRLERENADLRELVRLVNHTGVWGDPNGPNSIWTIGSTWKETDVNVTPEQADLIDSIVSGDKERGE